MYGDNLAANKLTRDHFVSTGNQYIYLPYFWIQEIVNKGIITVPHVSTDENIADLHTKSVTRQTVEKLLKRACGYEALWLPQLYANTPIRVTPMCDLKETYNRERLPDCASCAWIKAFRARVIRHEPMEPRIRERTR